MGNTSPAIDYIEIRLTLNSMLMKNPANMMHIDTPYRFALIDCSLTPVPGDTIALQLGEYALLEKLFRSGIITQDGETIDGQGWKR